MRHGLIFYGTMERKKQVVQISENVSGQGSSLCKGTVAATNLVCVRTARKAVYEEVWLVSRASANKSVDAGAENQQRPTSLSMSDGRFLRQDRSHLPCCGTQSMHPFLEFLTCHRYHQALHFDFPRRGQFLSVAQICSLLVSDCRQGACYPLPFLAAMKLRLVISPIFILVKRNGQVFNSKECSLIPLRDSNAKEGAEECFEEELSTIPFPCQIFSIERNMKMVSKKVQLGSQGLLEPISLLAFISR